MSDYDGILQEDMNGKLDTILEYLAALEPVPQKVTAIDERLIRVESRVQVIELAMTDLSQQHNQLDRRATKLETKAA